MAAVAVLLIALAGGVALLRTTKPASPGTTALKASASPAAAKAYSFRASTPVQLRDEFPGDVATAIRQAMARRDEAARRVIAAAETDLRRLRASVAVDAFVSDARSLGSRLQSVAGSNSHLAWLKEQFAARIVSSGEIAAVLNHRARELDKILSAIDDELLVALKLDSEFDGGQLAIPAINLHGVDRAIEELVSSLQGNIHHAVVESAASTAAGLVAGQMVHSFASDHLSYNDRGEFSPAGALTALGVSVVGGMLAEQAVEVMVDTKGTLRNKLDAHIDQLFGAILASHGTAAGWKATFTRAAAAHHEALVKALAESYGVNPASAIQKM